MGARNDDSRTKSHTTTCDLKIGEIAVGSISVDIAALRAALEVKVGDQPIDLGMKVAETSGTGTSKYNIPVELDGTLARRISEPDWRPVRSEPATVVSALVSVVTNRLGDVPVEDVADDWLAGCQIVDQDDLARYLRRHGLHALRLPLVRRAVIEFSPRYTEDERRDLMDALFKAAPGAGAKPKQHRDAVGIHRFYLGVQRDLAAARANLSEPRRKRARYRPRPDDGDGRRQTGEDHRLTIERITKTARTSLLRHFSTVDGRANSVKAGKVIDRFLAGNIEKRRAALLLTSLRFVGVSHEQVRKIVAIQSKANT